MTKFNGNIDSFLIAHRNTYELTTEELKNLMALCATCKEFNFGNEIALGPYLSEMSCIFKLESGLWITWDRDERKGFYNAKEFIKVNDACVSIIEDNVENTDDIDKKIIYFENQLANDITEKEINQFIYGTKFTHIKEKKLELKSTL